MIRAALSGAVLALFLAGPARAQETTLDGAAVPPPPISAKITDEAADVGYRPSFQLKSIFTFTPVIHGGLLAPYGTLPTPYSVLRTSPYGVVGLNAKVTGVVESLVIGTLGYTDLLSHKGIDDPGGKAASPASSLPAQTNFSQPSRVASAYADLGKVLTLSPSVKMAFFAAADAFEMNSLHSAPGSFGTTGLVEGNAGTLVMYKKGQNEASAFADFRLEGAGANMFRNSDVAVVPAGTLGAEYARNIRDGQRVATGVEATTQRADLGLRPYVQWSQNNVDTIVSGNFRHSRNDFYPDVAGAAAEVRVGVGHGVQVGILGDFEHQKYSMAPGPVDTKDMLLTVNVDLDRLFHTEASKRMYARHEGRDYRAQDSVNMNNRLPAGGYAQDFTGALAQSATLNDFIKSVHATTVDQILSAASAFTTSFSNNNYNYNEGPVPNSNNIEDIYKRGRASYLNGTTDPMLVCIGSSQFAAVLAEAMGKQAGIPIEAMASHVEVPDDKGQQAGHAVAAVKTQPYGIVFVDWGKLTPTYTFDTKQAFRIYDALQGIPSVYHTVTAGAEGHHVGYLFTDEGKAIVNNLTFNGETAKPPLEHLFNDDPRGAPTTVQRFKDLTRGKFQPQ